MRIAVDAPLICCVLMALRYQLAINQRINDDIECIVLILLMLCRVHQVMHKVTEHAQMPKERPDIGMFEGMAAVALLMAWTL